MGGHPRDTASGFVSCFSHLSQRKGLHSVRAPSTHPCPRPLAAAVHPLTAPAPLMPAPAGATSRQARQLPRAGAHQQDQAASAGAHVQQNAAVQQLKGHQLAVARQHVRLPHGRRKQPRRERVGQRVGQQVQEQRPGGGRCGGSVRRRRAPHPYFNAPAAAPRGETFPCTTLCACKPTRQPRTKTATTAPWLASCRSGNTMDIYSS